MAEQIWKRSEVPEEYTWDLSVLFASDEDWFRAYEELKAMGARYEEYRGRLCDNAERLLSFLRMDDEVSVKAEALQNYASCRSDQDTSNNFYLDMKSKANAALVSLYSASSFAAPEIMALSEDSLNLFYIVQPELLNYRRSIYKARRRKEHILSPSEEKLLAAAGEMADTPDILHGILSNADLRFDPVADKDGELHPLTDGSLVPLLESSDRTLRRNAFVGYYARLAEHKNTFAAMLDGQFKQLRFFSTARHYSGTLEAALDRTEVPTEVYSNLIETVHANLDKMYRYVALRKRALGLETLEMCDVYTPIVADSARRISFEEAKATVKKALAVMGEDYTALLQKGFDERWIDIYENEGKRSGAYSSGASRPHPFVLLNHKDTLDSMFTLAHEMGHALHSYHSTHAQNVSNSDYVIFVAEVASTCNEVLLMRYLLANTTDKKERAYLINHFLDSFKGTVYRQTMFAEFERWMGEMSDHGETLTADLLCAKYLELNKLYYGPDMTFTGPISLEWARIPHFFYNYYVFQYATGFSAAVALADRILTLGESAVADYKKFLCAGCSMDPISILKLAGVDMSSPEPINAGLKLFGELVEELETLI